MRTADYDFHLPPELIAQFPPEQRGESRMLVHPRSDAPDTLTTFDAIGEYLRPGDLLVMNDTQVINARLYGRKNGTPDGAHTEFLLLSPRDTAFRIWQAYAKPAKRIPPGTRIRLLDHSETFVEPEAWAETRCRNDDGTLDIELHTAGSIFDFLEKHGHLPLPPYIERSADASDAERYQTVFATAPGAVAAPTAGLHFTDVMLDQLRTKGVETATVTLHTGAGTFKPVTADDLTQHRMHSERYLIPEETVEAVNRAKQEGRRVIAVGTTSVRTLETVADKDGMIRASTGDTAIFLHPPYRPKCVDGLLTNFHLPKSTLLMLVSTFSSRERILESYARAIAARFRFYSYGDCMLILP